MLDDRGEWGGAQLRTAGREGGGGDGDPSERAPGAALPGNGDGYKPAFQGEREIKKQSVMLCLGLGSTVWKHCNSAQEGRRTHASLRVLLPWPARHGWSPCILTPNPNPETRNPAGVTHIQDLPQFVIQETQLQALGAFSRCFRVGWGTGGVSWLGPHGCSFTLTAESDDGPQCTICITEFVAGEAVRMLPCMHKFHAACIDVWLGESILRALLAPFRG